MGAITVSAAELVAGDVIVATQRSGGTDTVKPNEPWTVKAPAQRRQGAECVELHPVPGDYDGFVRILWLGSAYEDSTVFHVERGSVPPPVAV